MKFLVDNYATIFSTEPLYLSTTLNSIEGCSSAIFQKNNDISLYDRFDITKPDIYITSASFIGNDTISYLKENNNIYTILNISGINQDQLNKIDDLLDYHNIKSIMYIINYPNHNLTSKHFKIFVLPHCADIYLGNNTAIDYKIDNAIFIKSKEQISKRNGTYHYIGITNDLVKDADIVMPVMYLSNIYKNYNNIIFKSFGKIVPQYFYDAVLYGNNVIYEKDEENDITSEVLNIVFKDEINNLKECVRKKHTCMHRTKSLLSQLPCNDIVVKLGKMMEDIKWE